MGARRVIGGLSAVAGMCVWLAGTAVPVSAHHAFAAEFDGDKPVDFSGTVTKVEWINPHAYFWFDVKDESGEVKQWGAETIGPTALRQAGFLRGPASFRIRIGRTSSSSSNTKTLVPAPLSPRASWLSSGDLRGRTWMICRG